MSLFSKLQICCLFPSFRLLFHYKNKSFQSQFSYEIKLNYVNQAMDTSDDEKSEGAAEFGLRKTISDEDLQNSTWGAR